MGDRAASDVGKVTLEFSYPKQSITEAPWIRGTKNIEEIENQASYSRLGCFIIGPPY